MYTNALVQAITIIIKRVLILFRVHSYGCISIVVYALLMKIIANRLSCSTDFFFILVFSLTLTLLDGLLSLVHCRAFIVIGRLFNGNREACFNAPAETECE